MNLTDYISKRLELASNNLGKLDEDDIDNLTEFTNMLLDPNFILDALKDVSKNFATNLTFNNKKAQDLVDDITEHVRSVKMNNPGVTKLIDTSGESTKRLFKAIEIFLRDIKSKKNEKIEIYSLEKYLNQSRFLERNIVSIYENNQYAKGTKGLVNPNLSLLYIMNVIDQYFSAILMSEKEKILMSMNGVFTKNIKQFIKYLTQLITPKGGVISRRFETLVGNFVDHVALDNTYTIWGGSSTEPAIVGVEVKVEKVKVPFSMVEIPLTFSPQDFSRIAESEKVPVYLNEKEVEVSNDLECYDPGFILNERRLHNSLAKILLNDTSLSSYTWAKNKKECMRIVIDYIVTTYPRIKTLRTVVENIYLVSESKERNDELVVETFFDLLRLYNLKNVYGIVPEDPRTVALKDENLNWDKVKNWWFELKTQDDFAKQNSILAYPFIRKFKSEGNFVPDLALSDYKSPVKAYGIVMDRYKKNFGGSYTNPNAGVIEEKYYQSKSDNIIEVEKNNEELDISNNLALLIPHEATRYICFAIYGFILSRNYADYNLYYELHRKNYFGGSSSKAFEGSRIDKSYKSLYRDIIILGTWYFQYIKVDEQISVFSGRWNNINRIFLSRKGIGGLYLINEVNIIVSEINKIIKIFIRNSGDEETANDVSKAILDDFIKTIHLIIKASIEIVTEQDKLPLNLNPENIEERYNEYIKAYEPAIQLDSAIMSRYNLDDSIIKKIYKTKERYFEELDFAEREEEDELQILLNSLNSISAVDSSELDWASFVKEGISFIAMEGRIGAPFFGRFDALYRGITGKNIDDSALFSPTKTEIASLKRIVSIDSTPNDYLETKSDVDMYIELLKKQTFIGMHKRSPKENAIEQAEIDTFMGLKSIDEVEREVNNLRTTISKVIADSSDRIIPSLDPLTIVKNTYNTMVSREDSSSVFKEYLTLRYNPKFYETSSTIPQIVHVFIELVYANIIYNDIFDHYNTYGFADTRRKITDRTIGDLGSKFLFNEVVLINSRTNVVRTAENLELPPLYIFNTYFRYFTEFCRTKTTVAEQIKPYTLDEFIEKTFDIFKDGYISSMETLVPQWE